MFPLLSSAFINEEAYCFFSSESLWQVREPTWFIKMIMLTRSQLFFKAEQHLDFTASLKLTSQPVTVQAKKFIFCFFLAKSTPTNKVLSTAMKRWEKHFKNSSPMTAKMPFLSQASLDHEEYHEHSRSVSAKEFNIIIIRGTFCALSIKLL